MAGIKGWKKFERNNKTIAFNILSIPHNTKTINLAYKSKYNRKRENQVVLLMITNGEQSDEAEKWHYIALKCVRTANGFNRPIRSLSRSFRGITANNNGDFTVWVVYIHFEQIMSLKDMKDYVIIMIIVTEKCRPKIIKH